MLIRDTNGSVHYANFREAASSGASVNMFKSNSTLSTLVRHVHVHAHT